MIDETAKGLIFREFALFQGMWLVQNDVDTNCRACGKRSWSARNIEHKDDCDAIAWLHANTIRRRGRAHFNR